MKIADSLSYIVQLIFTFLKGIWSILWPILIVVLIIIIIKVIYQYVKYGESVFHIFRKPPKNVHKVDFLFTILNQLPNYKYVMKLKNLHADLCLLSENGITLFKIFPSEGNIIGRTEMEKIIVTTGESSRKINNPFWLLEQDKKVLQTQVGCEIHLYVLLSPKCMLSLEGIPVDIETIKMPNVYYQVTKDLTGKTLYTKEEIDQLYKKLRSRK